MLFIVPRITCWIQSHGVKLIIYDPLKVAGDSRVAGTPNFQRYSEDKNGKKTGVSVAKIVPVGVIAMKKRFHGRQPIFFFLFLLSFFVQEAFSQDGKSFLCKAQSERSTVYLLGSIHLLKKENYPLNQKIEDAFNNSNFLVVEANIQDQDKMNPETIMARAIYPANDNIAAHLSLDTYELLKKEAAKLDLPLEMINRQRPWFLSMALEAMELLKLGYDPGYGLDNYFLSKAAGQKKILELESLDEQVNLLSDLSDREQELMLLLTLKDLQRAAREVEQLVQAWKSGDMKGMEAIIAKSPKEDLRLTPIYEKLINDRNRKMLSKIEDYLKGNATYFVVVGAAHLVGEKGIVEALLKKGYRVEQL